MPLASASRGVLAAVVGGVICAGCGAASNPNGQTPVSLQELQSNSAVGVTYSVSVDSENRLSVRRLARTVRLTATKAVLTITRSAGSGRLDAAERAELRATLRRVDLR